MAIQAAALYATVGVTGANQSVAALGGVNAAVDRTMGKFSVLGLKSQGVGKGIRQVAGGIVKIGEIAAAGLTIATLASARAASSFQAQMELIHTQAGASQAEVDNLTKSVQDMVHAVGTNPDELAKGLYHIESVGVRGAAALDVLKASALGAKMGLADMESVSNALAAVSKSGSAIGGVQDMISAMGTLNAIVGTGNMRMQDLVDAFGTGILGTSKAFGVGLRELGSALAVLTDAGVPANVAATRLSMTFSHLAAPTAAALKTFKKLGVDQFQFAKDLRSPDGIFVAFQDLHDTLARMGEIKNGVLSPAGTADVTKIFGGSRFGATAMQLLGQMDRIKLKYDQIGASQQTFGEKVQATMETAGFKWGQFMADLHNTAVTFGQGVLPSLLRALGKLDDAIVTHRADFARFGSDVGGAIDRAVSAIGRIDWPGVARGFGTVRDVVGSVLDLIKQVPPEITLAFAGLVGVNKLAGGLLGKGAGNILGSAMSQFFGRGSAVNPMWVQTVGGFGLGGGAGPGASGGLFGKLFSFVGPALLVAGTVALATDMSGINDPSHKTPSGQTFRGTNDAATQISNLQRSIEQLTARAAGGDTFAASQLATSKAELARLLAIQAAGGTSVFGPDGTASDPLHVVSPEMLAALDNRNSEATDRAAAVAAAAHAAVLADRAARGIKDTGPSTSLTPRFKFLNAGHSGAQDVAVADALASGFEHGVTPLWKQGTDGIKEAIKVLEKDQKTVNHKDAAAIAADIVRLKAELARRDAAAHKAAADAAVAAAILAAKVQSTTEAIKDKDMNVTINLSLDSHKVANSQVVYTANGRKRII